MHCDNLYMLYSEKRATVTGKKYGHSKSVSLIVYKTFFSFHLEIGLSQESILFPVMCLL